jgi:hypothetical protein
LLCIFVFSSPSIFSLKPLSSSADPYGQARADPASGRVGYLAGEAFRVGRKRNGTARNAEWTSDALVESEPLEPIRMVERELTCPDGTKLVVQVPVYPPFRLRDRSGQKLSESQRKPAGAKRLAEED